MSEVTPQVGFVLPPSITKERGVQVLMQRVRRVRLLAMTAVAAEESDYVPFPTIVSMPAGEITEAEAAGLIADETTNVPIEMVKLPAESIARMRRNIRPRNGKPLPNIFAHRPVIYGERRKGGGQQILLEGVPLECRVDPAGSTCTGTVDTRRLTSSGKPAKVGWHFDGKDVGSRVEYAIINGSLEDENGTTREFGFVQGLGRVSIPRVHPLAEFHDELVDYIAERQEASYTKGTEAVTGWAVQLQPQEALLRMRVRELLHDGIPNILGSVSIMLSMNPAIPFHQFGTAAWESEPSKV